MFKRFFTIIMIMLLFHGVAFAVENAQSPCLATAQSLSLTGNENFYKVSENLYRGRQPDENGFKALENMGIKTVINLRTSDSDKEYIENTNLGYERISFNPFMPDKDEVIAFLKIATDPEKTPVFVHCHHGSDRTGVMVAAYRIIICGWSKERAIKEMVDGPFGFHGIFFNLKNFVKELDVEKIRKKAGLEKKGE